MTGSELVIWHLKALLMLLSVIMGGLLIAFISELIQIGRDRWRRP